MTLVKGVCCLVLVGLSLCLALGADARDVVSVKRNDSRLMALEDRIEGLEQEIRRLTDGVERIEHLVKSMPDADPSFRTSPRGADQTPPPSTDGTSSSMTGASSDEQSPPDVPRLDASQGSLQPRVPSSSPPTPSLAPSLAGPAPVQLVQPLPNDGDVAMYNDLQALIQRGDFPRAQAMVRTFIQKFPKSPLLPNVLFWGGEIALHQNENDQAAQHFLTVYTNHPAHPKAAEALVKLSSALFNLGKYREALTTLDKVENDFPLLPDPLKAAIKRQRAEAIGRIDGAH